MDTVWTKEMEERYQAVVKRKIPAEVIKTKQSAGMNFKFVSPAYITSLLNEAFANWNFEIVKFDMKETEKLDKRTGDTTTETYAFVLGRLTVPGLGFREQFGTQAMVRSADMGAMADTIKGAASDSLKKCASLFGIGLELYMGDTEGAMSGYGRQGQGQQGGYQQRQGTFQPKPQPQQTQQPKAQAPAPTQPKPEANGNIIWTEEAKVKHAAELAELKNTFAKIGAKTPGDMKEFLSSYLGKAEVNYGTDLTPNNIGGFVEFMRDQNQSK